MSASVDIVIGLGFGDEGKGTTVDWLTRQRQAGLVVRFNGGSQAAHNVVLPDGTHHTFAQWGSGTFAGANTFLSRFMMVNPLTAFKEAQALESKGVLNPMKLLTIDSDAPITTPFHVAVNRIKEMARCDLKHGSCGMGIGETASDLLGGQETLILRMRDLDGSREQLVEKLGRIQEFQVLKVPEAGYFKEYERHWAVLDDCEYCEYLADQYIDFVNSGVRVVSSDWLDNQLKYCQGAVIFEGAQGVLLDEKYGFAPYNTWSNCTAGNAHELIRGHGIEDLVQWGVLRTFHTRHGAGPFPSETHFTKSYAADDHNATNAWQDSFRTGAFDFPLARYALGTVDIDRLMLTHLDKLSGDHTPVVTHYTRHLATDTVTPYMHESERNSIIYDMRAELEWWPTYKFQYRVAYDLNVQLGAVSHGPTFKDKFRVV